MFSNMITKYGRWIELWPGSSDKKWGYILEVTEVGVFIRFSRIVIDTSFSGCAERVNDVYFYPFKKLKFRFTSIEDATDYTVKKAFERQYWNCDDPDIGFVQIEK